jgi:hypothetical protein
MAFFELRMPNGLASVALDAIGGAAQAIARRRQSAVG